MDIAIGKTVVLDGEIFKCVEGNRCHQCDALNFCFMLDCVPSNRADGQLVIFKKVGKQEEKDNV